MEEFYKKYITNTTGTDDNSSINTADSIHFWNDEWNVMDKSAKTYSYDCCKNCPNNPANNPNASGVCFCTLHSMEKVRY